MRKLENSGEFIHLIRSGERENERQLPRSANQYVRTKGRGFTLGAHVRSPGINFFSEMY